MFTLVKYYRYSYSPPTPDIFEILADDRWSAWRIDAMESSPGSICPLDRLAEALVRVGLALEEDEGRKVNLIWWILARYGRRPALTNPASGDSNRRPEAPPPYVLNMCDAFLRDLSDAGQTGSLVSSSALGVLIRKKHTDDHEQVGFVNAVARVSAECAFYWDKEASNVINGLAALVEDHDEIKITLQTATLATANAKF
ncbi:hypothetical protein HK104_008780 [Borealophlyctis nickersoniae]|nr:hypothetical protein HK104_008780 [Borealophlyctis nickersoniae]